MGTYQAAVLVWFYYLLVPEKAVHLVFAGANVPQSEEPLRELSIARSECTTRKCSVSGIVNWSVYYTNDSGLSFSSLPLRWHSFLSSLFPSLEPFRSLVAPIPKGKFSLSISWLSATSSVLPRPIICASVYRPGSFARYRRSACEQPLPTCKLRRKTQPSSFKLDNWLKQAPIRERWQLAANSPTTQSYCAAMLLTLCSVST